MKALLAAVLGLALSAAQAGTVTLFDSDCTATRICSNVENDAGLDIDISAYTLYPRLSVIVNGAAYSGPGNSAALDQGPLTLYANDGSWLTFSAHWRTWRTCQRSGHNVCTSHWELQSGSVALP